MNTVAELIKALEALPQDLPVAYKCTENNLEGHIDVTSVRLAPADFGQLILIS